MQKHWIIVAVVVVSLVEATAMRAQNESPVLPDSRATFGAKDSSGGVVQEITFPGLRRISPRTLQRLIDSRVGDEPDAAKIEHDVRVLARTGWFETVRAEALERNPGDGSENSKQHFQLTFYVPEEPFLTDVDYRGSALLSRAQIQKLLAEKKLTAKLGEPENPVKLDQAGRAIESALAELGHPYRRVQIVRMELPQATVHVRFEIIDGPYVPVKRVSFVGNPVFPERLLRREMQLVPPGALLAGIRGKDAYTAERVEEDRKRLLTYYQNHGYPEARVATARVEEFEGVSRRWFPFPSNAKSRYLTVAIPIEAGPLYRVGSMTASSALKQAAGMKQIGHDGSQQLLPMQIYSAQKAENLRRAWEWQVRRQAKRENDNAFSDVEANVVMDASTHTVLVRFGLSAAAPFTVRRLEFGGLHHFPDHYLRKRVGVQEGVPLDERALEAGLRSLARTGYFKPIKKEDVQIVPDEARRTLDVTINVEELGKQRVSMIGGRGQFGSTLGIAYSLFDILDREEVLTSKIDDGPESLQLALGFVKEGFLGSRGSLALSVFNTFLRPYLTGSTKGPFFKQRTEGVSADWSYSLSTVNAVSASFNVSRSLTTYTTPLPFVTAGGMANDVRAESSSHAAGLGWTRESGNERLMFADSVSGGWLGGSENLVRSKAEYARVVHDPIFGQHNAWAVRTVVMGTGSYSGDMPLSARLFGGDGFVRGLRDGELGPAAITSSAASTNTAQYATSPAGANLIGALNMEYRVRLNSQAEAAGFFDLGSGALLPNWLGPSRPLIVEATNGAIHGSTGLELRWEVPGIGIPVRAYYAVNALRLNRPILMPDASIFRVRNRLTGFGWGLGALF